MAMTRHRLVILDMDGTFLDSRGIGKIEHEWAYEAFKRTLSRYGLQLSIEEIDTYFLMPLHSDGERGVRQFCDRFNLDCEDFWAMRERDVIEAKIKAIQRGEINLCKGSESVIKYLSRKYQLAVVSDSQQACVDFAVEYFGLRPYFRIWYGRRSDLKSLSDRKPSPFYINKVLGELDIQRRAAILVDDSPVGVLAAKRAGIDSILISNDGRSEKEPESKLEPELEPEPTYIVRSITELKRVL